MNQNKRMTIVGAGNTGLTAAYHLTTIGNDICLYGAKGFDEQLDMIRSNGGITAIAELDGNQFDYPGLAKIHTLTGEMETAIEFADIILMPVTSFAQELLFEQMLPYLTDQHTIILMPGNYGSLVLHKLKNKLGYSKLNINIVDVCTSPWACRITGPAEIAIFGMKTYLPLGVFPAKNTAAVVKQLSPHFPLPLKALKNVIAAGLENVNFGGHPLMTTLNMGLLENFKGDFSYYKDCCSPAIARANDALDKERLAIGKGFDLSLLSELDAMNSLYGSNCKSVYELNSTSTALSKLTSAPNSPKHRYITEDAPYLLVPCYHFANLLNIEVPLISSCLHIINIYNETNYFNEGRTLEKMGIDNMDVEDIFEFVN